jgi:hypothetical protein
MVELDACVRLNHTNTHADKQGRSSPGSTRRTHRQVFGSLNMQHLAVLESRQPA